MKRLLLLLVVISAVALVACGKKKADPEKYTEFCAEVVKCDKQMQAQPTGLDLCKKTMATLEEKMPQAVSPLQDCVKSQKCEKKDMTRCFFQIQQQQGLSMPIGQ
ncbi:MAG: hypothetical protein HY042_12850 [Spirochaetia bacterium]|nr:hypothetical protein [Spirochaetia bacterium]